MSISFTCEFCSRKYRVDDGLAGRKVKCKECGTDLTIPSNKPSAPAPVKAKAAPRPDLYGLEDDGEDEAPLPPPRRPGAVAASASSPSGGTRRRSSSSGGGDNSIRNFGWGMLLFGAVAFILPKFGLVFAKGNNAWDPEVQTYVGLFAMGLGVVFVVIGFATDLDGSEGSGKLVMFGGYAALFVSAIVAAVAGLHGPRNGNPNPNVGMGAPPNFQGPNFQPPPPPHFGGPPGMPNDPGPGAPLPANNVHISLSNGHSGPATGAFGARMIGVDFHAEYRMNGQKPPGVMKYVTVIEGGRKSASDGFSMLHDAGEIDLSGMTFDQSDGPFSMHIEADMAGGGMRRERVSNDLPLPWIDAPQPQQQPQQPNFGQPGQFPGQPGMPNGNRPGQPGFGQPPGIPPKPGPRMPPFGPRGR